MAARSIINLCASLLFVNISCLVHLAGAASPIIVKGIPSRIVRLSALLTVENGSPFRVDRYDFRITSPASGLPYQNILRIGQSAISVSNVHSNKIDRYIELRFQVPGQRSVNHRVDFYLHLIPVDFLQAESFPHVPNRSLREFLQPSRYIESDSPEVLGIANGISRSHGTELAKAKAAYEFPESHLTYEINEQATGAQKALQTQIGDCTEYAAVFAALSRGMGIPARVTSGFNLGAKKRHQMPTPNHNLAEVYLSAYGWLPVDPLLGHGEYKNPVGFARLGSSIIVLIRGEAWTWSAFKHRNRKGPTAPKGSLKPSLTREIDVLHQGASETILKKFLR